MGRISDFVSQHLWDTPKRNLSLIKHARFIIEGVLEYGDIESFKWLTKTFEEEQIKETLIKGRRISPKTGNFYALYFGLPKGDLLCIKKPFIQKKKGSNFSSR